MKNLWDDAEAAGFSGDLNRRVYTSRLLGREPNLVLHGGGNTSVKIRERTIVGTEEDFLYVKGSGWDLATIEAAGFPAVRLDHLLALAELESLTDAQMVNEMRTHMTDASAPTPSVEAILHAALPYKFVDHTHADAVVAVCNTDGGEERIREIYGDRVVVIPYVMPGFDLARLCAQQFPRDAGPSTIGMILMNHGVFSFGATAKESYDRMIELVSDAEAYLAKNDAWDLPVAAPAATKPVSAGDFAALRRRISDAAGRPMLLMSQASDHNMAFARRPDVATISQQGPATPDHVIRTKRVPLVGDDVDAYATAYRAYFERHAPHVRDGQEKAMLDPAPRVVLDPAFGLATAGPTAKDAMIAADIYCNTIDIISRAERLGGWRALPPQDLFDMEYWELEQAKLKKGGSPPPLTGEIALITGAASGIGKACVESLLQRGAAVVGFDIDPAITSLHTRPDFLGIAGDVANDDAVRGAIETTARHFGGLDLLILNAGVFPPSCRIDALPSADWRRVMDVNLDANLSLMRECHPFLKQAPGGGRVVVIGSKNVPAPGPGVAAYSAAKAALNQLARVAALEWGADGIRVNSLHPNAVFDTGLWTEEVLAARAKSYGLSVADYKTNNLLRVEVTSRDVAELAAEMCGPLFAKTVGSQVPVDGGNERVV